MLWNRNGLGKFCVYSRLCYEDWIEGGKGRDWENCVLTADCVRGIG
jgi:hypothetical protein